jgi:uncharacterized protein (DUF305 family)
MRLRPFIAAIGLTAVLGAACSSDDPSTVDAGDTTSTDHNDADVVFAQQMIPHHSQALEMAQLAADRAEDPQVKDLGARIEGAQEPEIEQMQAWLEAWGEDPESEAMDGMEHGDAGMMTDDDMARLEAAAGAEFDAMFLEMMIQHHSGAVDMAETEIADGRFPEAIELATAIKQAQEAEIDQMRRLLDERGS